MKLRLLVRRIGVFWLEVSVLWRILPGDEVAIAGTDSGTADEDCPLGELPSDEVEEGTFCASVASSLADLSVFGAPGLDVAVSTPAFDPPGLPAPSRLPPTPQAGLCSKWSK